MENDSVVQNPAPVAAPTQESAPAPQADDVVKAEDTQPTVSVSEIIAPKKAADKKDGSDTPKGDEKAPDANPTPATAKPAKDGEKSEQAITSQKDFNTALGKRAAEMRKEYAPLVKLAQAVKDANPNMTDEQIIATLTEQRNEKLGINPDLATFLDKRLGTNEEPVADDEAPESEEDQDAFADRLGKQADEIQKHVPDFDVKDFLGKNIDKLPALQRGYVSLNGLYYEQNISTMLQKAHDEGFAAGQAETAENIRNRNAKLPNPPTPSAPGDTTVDFGKMSKKQFEEAEAAIDRALKEGKRVTV